MIDHPPQRRKRRSAARARADYRLDRGNACDYMYSLKITPGANVVLACRESSSSQDAAGNLARQVDHWKQHLESLGANVVYVHAVKHSGNDPSWLIPAVEIAKEHNAILVAESPCRFIRHRNYTSSWSWNGKSRQKGSVRNRNKTELPNEGPNAQASKADLDNLKYYTQDVTLMTIADPDATPGEERSIATKRGMGESEKKPGRPKRKKDIKKDNIQKAIGLRKKGMSYRDIANEIGVAHQTIYDWLKPLKKGCPVLMGD